MDDSEEPLCFTNIKYPQIKVSLSKHGGFPGGSVAKNPPVNAGDSALIPESGRSPGEVNGNPLQYSCLDSSMDREARWAAVHGIERVRHGLVTKQHQEVSVDWTEHNSIKRPM